MKDHCAKMQRIAPVSCKKMVADQKTIKHTILLIDSQEIIDYQRIEYVQEANQRYNQRRGIEQLK